LVQRKSRVNGVVSQDSSFRSSVISWQVVISIETEEALLFSMILKSRLNRPTLDPEIPFALAITIINFPGFLSFTTCIKDEVALVFVAVLNCRILSG